MISMHRFFLELVVTNSLMLGKILGYDAYVYWLALDLGWKICEWYLVDQ